MEIECFLLDMLIKNHYLYNENYNKTDMYLVKGDKVLILDVKRILKTISGIKYYFQERRV